ncbi:MAG: 1,4-alpha-glucan branching protein GlgB [Lachnospiraceae bacterium]|nr:1,4-alpha-glucan branching protein GlgB [Lachnospiraceae bacterium]
MDMYGFYTGKSFDAYEFLGAHVSEKGVTFRTFAPGAAGVVVLYGKDNWEAPMNRAYDGNFYEVTVANAKVNEPYQFRIYKKDGTFTDHCDPYGFGMEMRPDHRSIVRDMSKYTFSDSQWMKKRTDGKEQPMNIYEMHMGSWHTKTEEGEKWYRYDEIAKPLIKHLKDSGYNYVEFLPLSEHPCDESWGYQNTGFFAPTSRYGTADDLKKLIDALHKAGIGAIFDLVPVHFAVDDYGLSQYDGTYLYEYPSSDVGVSEWGSCNFMHSRGEVRSFLQSCANYWLKEFHFDGLRMDAISRIIFWNGDENRGVNGNGIDFLKVMNQGLKQINPNCMLFAEDSTSYPNVTAPVEQGGLGFDYKWDMGWMHDTLEYFQTPPEQRSEHYHKITFSMMYFRNEHYMMPFSHDEVVHGKATILQKMHGDYEPKFPQARAMYLYMFMHPGKKLNFMGNEIGQLREWDEKREQDWDILQYPIHDGFYHYMKELNKIYLEHTALSQWDYREEGFQWLDCHQEERCIYAIQRRSGEETLIAVFNFGDKVQAGYTVPLPKESKIKTQLLLDSDWQRFGGGTVEPKKGSGAKTGPLTLDLPAFSGMLFAVEKA